MADLDLEQLRRSRIDETIDLLRAIGLPRAQQNERSALTLLGLLDLRPDQPWSDARTPMRGITQLMGFFREAYGKDYAPNTRETVRRFSMHQLVAAGAALLNPDDPTRPVNSPNNRYQASPALLNLVRSMGANVWDSELEVYLTQVGSLRERYAAEREQQKIAVQLPSEASTILLTPSGKNPLIKAILEEFCPRFTPGAHVVYVGDAGEKWAVVDQALLTALGVLVDAHGKMPDVVVYQEDRGWLVLVEAVTSHGPVNPKRVDELRVLFAGASAGLVFVTAFESRQALGRYLGEISWETEVWLADAPSHMVHFDGQRYLGPYA